MNKTWIIAIIFAFISVGAMAQVEVVADGRLQTILEQHILYNEISKTVSGYRIRLAVFSGTGAKQKAFAIKEEIEENYTDIPIYVIFNEPNFIVKCGDYLTRLDAYSAFQVLKDPYPKSTIIKDMVNLPVLNKDDEDLYYPEDYEEFEEDL